MKKFNYIIAIFLIANLDAQPIVYSDSIYNVVFTNQNSIFKLLLNDTSMSFNELQDLENKFTKSCEIKPIRNKKVLVNRIFTKIENTFLQKYDSMATVNDIFKSGKFNCVGGVALMSYALTVNKIEHKIIETAHHSYIKLNIDNSEILLETTDAENGFITSELEIKLREEKYKLQSCSSYINLVKIALGENSKIKNSIIQNEISIKQLAGLNYFNMAVNNYFRLNYTDALLNLEKAALLYPSNRVNGLMLLCMNKIIFHTESSKEIKDLMKKKTINFQQLNSLAMNVVKNNN